MDTWVCVAFLAAAFGADSGSGETDSKSSKLDDSFESQAKPRKELQCYHEHGQENIEDHCATFWDGISCWPPTEKFTTAVISCFTELNGVSYDVSQNASRKCLEGVWENYSDYSQCHEKVSNVPQTSPAHSTISSYSLSLVALSLAVFVFI